eukprot:3131705-Amphidinium_carterae.1
MEMLPVYSKHQNHTSEDEPSLCLPLNSSPASPRLPQTAAHARLQHHEREYFGAFWWALASKTESSADNLDIPLSHKSKALGGRVVRRGERQRQVLVRDVQVILINRRRRKA